MSRADHERKEKLRAFLTGEKRRLWSEVRDELFRKQGEDLTPQYDLPQDIGERGIIDLLADISLAVADIRREELTRIEEALRRLDEGNYGICDDCGEWIAEARLQADPYVACCLRCQNRRESALTPPHPTL
ncbi:TraR/DksA family transcriptional regulator [Geobacter sp. SVR]|uniref:TraR/DksA family transcriptional regulator n=1 Tax=Geobacter sp. SVR TaxID=2495594 RepID=UPI00143F01D7|nr:TraR/DksA family transcriptional regulator [Geobacter sp. SVR]BCS53354.1 molecular chaperone DnaK [Geobacter sp. SVR]GCF85520.1 molecular chaperone DnaK [Geobacter sp. SVR]